MPIDTDQLAKIQNDYRRRLPEKAKQVGDLWNKLQYFNWNDSAFQLLYQLVHNLAGNGKTFGLPAVSEQAQILEQYLSSIVSEEQPPDDGQRGHISVLVASLIAVCNPTQKEIVQKDDVDNRAENIEEQRQRRLVFIVDDDQHMADFLAQHLQSIGYQVQTFLNAASLWRVMSGEEFHPSAVVMDIVLPEGSFAGIEVIERLREISGERTPVVFLSARTDMNARLRALRAGGDAYVTKPVDIDRLVQQLDTLTLPRPEHDVRVLLVDGDGKLASNFTVPLTEAGMAVNVVNHAMETLEQLSRWKPDILVLDNQMPECDGIELAKIIRQQEEYITLPIVFISAEANVHHEDHLLGVGAQAYLPASVETEVLINEIEKLAKISRRILNKVKEVSRRDPLTGLDNRRYFVADLEKATAIFPGQGNVRYFYYVMLDHIEIVRERYGVFELSTLVAELACYMRQQLDSQYRVTVLSEGVYGALTPAHDAQTALETAQQLVRKIAGYRFTIDEKAINLTCSLGLVKVNTDAKSVKDLLRSAERLAERSSESGGNAVQTVAFFDAQEDSQLQGQVRLDKMVRALQARAFQLMFQPILNVVSTEKEMYEALVRLQDEDGRILLPIQFMDNLQEMGLLLELDRWVTRQMINAASQRVLVCPAADYLIKLSAESLRVKDFSQFVKDCLPKNFAGQGHRIIFELSEKLVLTHTELAADFAKSVNDLGCSIAIDHFGSTGSSLKLLSKVPALLVKVHNTVVNSIATDENSRRYIRSLIRGAQQQDVQVIVGALEDPRSLGILCEWGVVDFQGYLIQEPNESIQLDIEDAVLSTGV